MSKVYLIIFLAVFAVSCSDNSDAPAFTGRWYTQTQVDAGRTLFQANCASCHGADAQGTENWTTTLADGSYPPPPLNGTAHAWHHPLAALRRTINIGSIQLGGKMPAFKGKFSNDDIDALIAFFQSKWEAKVYDAWMERGGLR